MWGRLVICPPSCVAFRGRPYRAPKTGRRQPARQSANTLLHLQPRQTRQPPIAPWRAGIPARSRLSRRHYSRNPLRGNVGQIGNLPASCVAFRGRPYRAPKTGRRQPARQSANTLHHLQPRQTRQPPIAPWRAGIPARSRLSRRHSLSRMGQRRCQRTMGAGSRKSQIPVRGSWRSNSFSSRREIRS